MSEMPLAGLRLGRVERLLLVAAPRSSHDIGAYVNLPKSDPAIAAVRLRAAHRLEAAGLLELERIPTAGRVPDPRRELPVYEAGRFWRYADPVRIQVHWRVAMWRTPLGDGVRIFFDRELTTPGKRIRWDAARVEKACRYAEAHPVPPARRGRMLAEARRALARTPTLDEVEERQLGSPRPGPRRTEYLPEGVEGAAEEERWREAVRAARRAHPNIGSARLVAAATEGYDSGRASAA